MPDVEERINRLLSLIPYVIKHQGVSLNELCEVYGISREQLLKDLQLIFLCGQPDYTPADLIEVDMDDDRVRISMADYFARPLRFTPAELSGLYLACSALVKLSGLPPSSLTSAMQKIGEALGMAPMSPDDIDKSVDMPSLAPEHGALSGLSRALERKRVVEMEYYTYGRDDLSRRRVRPLSLEFGMGHWYLRAWDERSQETRVFRVDRIKDLKVTRKSFEPPPEEGGEPSSPFRVSEPGDIEVKLRFLPSLTRWAGEQRIFTKTRKEGNCLVCTLYTDTLPWLERELLRYGPEVEIISPPQLKDRVRQRARNILSIYE
jgi:proteasome accessory factor C